MLEYFQFSTKTADIKNSLVFSTLVFFQKQFTEQPICPSLLKVDSLKKNKKLRETSWPLFWWWLTLTIQNDADMAYKDRCPFLAGECIFLWINFGLDFISRITSLLIGVSLG